MDSRIANDNWKADMESRLAKSLAESASSMADSDEDVFLLTLAAAQCNDSFLMDPKLHRQLEDRGLVGRLTRMVRGE